MSRIDLLAVHERYGPWIRSRLQALLPRDWEDAVQDVMVRLHRALARMRDGSDAAVRAVIARTVRSVSIDELRRRARHPGPVEPPAERADPGAVPGGETAEERARLARALDELPERERSIVRLRFHDGLSFREIAELLDVPQGSVAGGYSRGMERLREELR
jgi:RNA polymerase sigma-70 factor (ECF subfamily)